MAVPVLDPPKYRALAMLRSLIASDMTVANGYYYDWGSVDEYAEADQVFPISFLAMPKEDPHQDYVEGRVNADQYSNVVRLKWRAQPEVPPEMIEDGRISDDFDIDLVLARLDHDIKRFMRRHNSTVIWHEAYYRGHEELADPDPSRCGWLESQWDLQYVQDQQEPTTIE